MAQKFTPKGPSVATGESSYAMPMRTGDLGVRAAQAERAANQSGGVNRTGDMSPGMRSTLGTLGSAADIAGQAMSMLTGFASQKTQSQYQKNMKQKMDKLNETAGKMGDTRDKMADLQGKMDALQSTLDTLAKMGCEAKDDLDKYQKEFDDAKKEFDQAQKDLSSAQDKLDRATQDLKNIMNNNPYPNTPAGRRQWNTDKNAATQAQTDAAINASNAQDVRDRVGNDAYNAEQAKNGALDKLNQVQDSVKGVQGDADALRAADNQARADYMNQVAQQKQTLGEMAQTSRDFYNDMMNQAKIAQGGSTLSSVGRMMKLSLIHISEAINTTMDWAKLSGSTGAFTPGVNWAKMVTTGVAQGLDRGQSAGEIASNIGQSAFGYQDLVRATQQLDKAVNSALNGDFGNSVAHGLYGGSAFARAAGQTAENVLPMTPYAPAAPFAKAAGNMIGATMDSFGQDAKWMSHLDKTAGNEGEMLATGVTSAPYGFLKGGAEFMDTMTGNQGWFDTSELDQARRDFNQEIGKGLETEWDSMFKAPEPITGDRLTLPDNPCTKQTGDPTNTKNPNRDPNKNKCPKPKPKPLPNVNPRAPYDDSGSSTGSLT